MQPFVKKHFFIKIGGVNVLTEKFAPLWNSIEVLVLLINVEAATILRDYCLNIVFFYFAISFKYVFFFIISLSMLI